MLAARLYGPKDLRLEEIPIPTISDNEVLVKVKAAALCGTDIRMYHNGLDHGRKEPLTIGHEFSGTIELAGKNVVSLKPGMRVSIAPNIGCGYCDFCVSGNVHMCKNLIALGINLDGAFAEYIKIPEQAVLQGNIIELGKSISFEEAAINEALSCVYNGFLRCDIHVGDYVLVVGAGPIGIMHARFAKSAGAAKVMLNDVSEERLALCKTYNPDFITIDSEHLHDRVMEETRNRGLDVCITACPSPQAQKEVLELMGFNGRVNFFGGLPKSKEIVDINTNLIHYKQLIITGTSKANTQMVRKTLELIDSGILPVKDLITSKYPLKEINRAIENAAAGKGIKTVIEIS